MVLLLLIALVARRLLSRRCEAMYKAFLANKKQQEEERKSGHQNIPEVDPEIDKIKKKVDAVWTQIESQCAGGKVDLNGKCKDKQAAASDWQIVRLFVSSTFADFFNEREVLVKKVFPELREWCRDRHLKLIECDLRWGVPRDTPSSQTVSICLEEIDKCIDVSDGSPLFIGLLGERYGWIPPDDDVSPDAREKYKWVDGTSITSMEILHGAYRTRNPNAAFFLRNPSVVSDIPDSHIRYFVDKDPLASHHLKILKEKLTSTLPEQMFHYEPKFKQLSEVGDGKESRVDMEGFEDFAKDALEFMKSAILRIHPKWEEPKQVDPLQQEQETQWLYALDKADNMIGRQTEKEILVKYLRDGAKDQLERTGDLEDWDVTDSDVPLCVVEAPSGWGKTTLVSSVINEMVTKQTDWKVFYHLVGSTPSSVEVKNLLQRLLSVLVTLPGDEDLTAREGEDYTKLIDAFKKALSRFKERSSEKLIIIIDNLNALSNSDTMHHLSWLPPFLPPNIRGLVSTNQHLPTSSRVFEHPTLKLSLSAMTQDQLADIATQYLGAFSKKLHPTQLTALFSKTKVNNPLWLSLMVEELRIFGSFDLMDKRIAEMPTSLEGFLVQVFERLFQEDGSQNLVKRVLCLIASSRYGLPSDQILQILGDPKTNEPIALLEWLQVKRSLKPYLRMSGFLEEMITFSHDAVQNAVCEHFLSERADARHWITVLADYYQFRHESSWTRVSNVLYYLKKGRLLQRMVQFMRSDRGSFLQISPFQRSDYLKDCRCRGIADAVISHTAPVMLCPPCSTKPRGFTPVTSWPNKNLCVICGVQVLNKSPERARACMKHAQLRGRDMVKCFLCNAVANTNNNNNKPSNPNFTSSPGLLCQFCSFGNGAKTCAVLSCDRL